MSSIEQPLPLLVEANEGPKRGYGEAAARMSRWPVVFRRLGALIIDGLMMWGGYWLIVAGSVAALGIFSVVVILAYGLAIFLYYPIMEVCFGGSLGKMLFGLTVVTKDGERIGGGQAFIRAVFALLEFSPLLLFGLFAFILALITPTRQRAGDIYASTYVVKRRDLEEAKQHHMLTTFA